MGKNNLLFTMSNSIWIGRSVNVDVVEEMFRTKIAEAKAGKGKMGKIFTLQEMEDTIAVIHSLREGMPNHRTGIKNAAKAHFSDSDEEEQPPPQTKKRPRTQEATHVFPSYSTESPSISYPGSNWGGTLIASGAGRALPAPKRLSLF